MPLGGGKTVREGHVLDRKVRYIKVFPCPKGDSICLAHTKEQMIHKCEHSESILESSHDHSINWVRCWYGEDRFEGEVDIGGE